MNESEKCEPIMSIQRFKFFSLAELMQRPTKENWLIKDYLSERSLCVLFGEPGHMKSFLAMDMGLCIASGKDWHGQPLKKAGPVLYIAGEGYLGIAKRLNAWCYKQNVSPESIPFYVSNSPAQILDKTHTKHVLEAINTVVDKHGMPALIIIDTLNRNFGPGDENSTPDMTAFVNFIDVNIVSQYGCSVLIVHHSPLNDPKRARGASSLKGALDWEYRVVKKKNSIELFSTKAKDYDSPPQINFEVVSVQIEGCSDDDGEIMSSCVLRKTTVNTTENQSIVEKLNNASRVAYGCLMQLYPSRLEETEGVPIDKWQELAFRSGISPANSVHSNKKAFERALIILTSYGLVEGNYGLYWPIKTNDKDKTL